MIIELIDDDALREKLEEFNETIDTIIFIENHHYKFMDDKWYGVARVLNYICKEREIKIEFFASDDELAMECENFNAEANFLGEILRFFRFFWRRQKRYEYLWKDWRNQR